MNSKIKKIILPLIIILTLGVQQAESQTNKVEFKEEIVKNDLNSIEKISAKKILRKKQVKSIKGLEKIKTLADLERIVERKRKLRYRNKRNIQGKCYKETADACETK